MIQLYSKSVKTALGVGMPTMCTYITIKSITSRGGRAQLFKSPQPQFYHLKEALLQLRIHNFERNVVRHCISAFCNHNFFQQSAQRWGIVGSAKRCRHCILGSLCSAYWWLESQNLTRNPSPPPQKKTLCTVQCTLYTEHCIKSWDSSFELAENIKRKIQRRHIFADLIITHLCVLNCKSATFWKNVYLHIFIFTSAINGNIWKEKKIVKLQLWTFKIQLPHFNNSLPNLDLLVSEFICFSRAGARSGSKNNIRCRSEFAFESKTINVEIIGCIYVDKPTLHYK